MAWKWRRKTYLMFCVAAHLAFLLTTVGLSSSAWTQGQRDGWSTQAGLLSFCKRAQDNYTTYECGSFSVTEMPAWFGASVVLSIASAALLFAVVPVSCFLHVRDSRREDVSLLTAFGLFTTLLGLVGAILYAALWDGHRGTGREGALSWGIAVFLAAHVCAAVAFLVLCVLSRARISPSRSRTRVKPQRP